MDGQPGPASLEKGAAPNFDSDRIYYSLDFL